MILALCTAKLGLVLSVYTGRSFVFWAKVGASNDGYFAEFVSHAAKATTCTVPEVEKQIKQLTEEHAPGGDEFISSKVSVLQSQAFVGWWTVYSSLNISV